MPDVILFSGRTQQVRKMYITTALNEHGRLEDM